MITFETARTDLKHARFYSESPLNPAHVTASQRTLCSTVVLRSWRKKL